jgi:hypothetical protein
MKYATASRHNVSNYDEDDVESDEVSQNYIVVFNRSAASTYAFLRLV